MPEVSVILTVYKSQWLKECIDSVLNQSYKDWELIILEDNSPDLNVKKILKTYSSHPRVKIFYSDISEEDRYKTARYATLINYGVRQMSSGKYITYLNDDDFYYPDRLQKMVDKLYEENVYIVYGNQQVVDAGGNNAGIREVHGVIDNAWDKVDHNSVMHYRSIFDEVDGWEDSATVWGGADSYFWRRMTEAGYLFYPIEGDPLDAKRYHEDAVQWKISYNVFFPE
jgi:spore maturation protein CgeD